MSVAAIAPIATLTVPVCAYENADFAAHNQTLLTGPPATLLAPTLVIYIALAITGWARTPGRLWSAAGFVASLAACLVLTELLRQPGIFWDGVDAEGNSTGGYELPEPSFGFAIWVVSVVLATAAAGLHILRGTPTAHRVVGATRPR